MARKRPQVDEVSYGLYDRFDPSGKGLPRVVEFTTAVPPEVGREFGYVLKIRGGRGLTIEFEIDHPRVPDADGAVMEPFRGREFVRSSEFEFFLGDALWGPVEWMVGEWRLTTWLEGKRVHRRTFEVMPPPPELGEVELESLPMQ